ncbi:magnesium and cobalt transport protein CorA [Desulforamulus reducens MI-1]|uniref:Magnesium transport protein CorA n=1 Tax=Desulforamulus reducens (strain ATCC BAA-1160 / DSM 100696 / MI-1) TaxID=349161 RepID=A4J6W4_DESRM|nr:magnesium/cobalt transporter CorA [Desulforamulus reducens]ABO50817.1 magnesium and cobalt transport protein CorA [Desulforamulus reducens MI-1]
MIKTYMYDHNTDKMRHDVSLDNLHPFLTNKNNFLWVDLYNFSEEEIKYVANAFDFHELAVEDCMHYSPRAKLDKYDDYYFLMMHAIRYNEERDEEIMLVQLNIFLGENYVVTVHKNTLPSLGRMAKICLNDCKLSNQGRDFFLYSIIDGLVDEYFPVLDRIGDRIEDLEDEIYEKPSRETTDEFLALKRTILTMRRAITPQRRIFYSISSSSFTISEDNQPYYLDLKDHLERISDTIDGYKDLTDGALATYSSIISARTTETMRVLTVISTIFMPLTFVTGFFGMNVPLPDQTSLWSTVSITLGLVLVSLWMVVLFRQKKWM